MSSIFLSHNHNDKPFVKRLAQDLQRAGIRVWIDEAELEIGDSLIEQIREGINEMEHLGVVLSSNSAQSPWVKREVDIAMNQEIEGKRVKVLPLVIGNCKLPGFLEGKLYADFRDPQQYTTELARVLRRLGAGNTGNLRTEMLTEDSMALPETSPAKERTAKRAIGKWYILLCIGVVSVFVFVPIYYVAFYRPSTTLKERKVREAEEVPFPPYQGPKRKIMVRQYRLPQEDIERYPILVEKRMGFGLSSILVETLFDTKRFVFREENEELLKRLVELWEKTEDGILVRNEQSKDLPESESWEFDVSAQWSDFIACSPAATGLIGGRVSVNCVTSVGVLVRFVNTSNGDSISSASDSLSPKCTYTHTVNLPLYGDSGIDFDQSALGNATLRATRCAVLDVLQKLDRLGW
jgi:hypothetical protein